MLESIKNYLVLPKELSRFENEYLKRMNGIALWFFVAHLPVLTLIAWFNDTQPLLALSLFVAGVGGACARDEFLGVETGYFDDHGHHGHVYGWTTGSLWTGSGPDRNAFLLLRVAGAVSRLC